MRHVDKRRWVCTNIQGECLMSQPMGAALCQEVPADRKCVLCQSDITILSEAANAAKGIVEFISEWYCEDCLEVGPMEGDRAPEKCPRCGGNRISKPPIKKGGPFEEGPEIRY